MSSRPARWAGAGAAAFGPGQIVRLMRACCSVLSSGGACDLWLPPASCIFLYLPLKHTLALTRAGARARRAMCTPTASKSGGAPRQHSHTHAHSHASAVQGHAALCAPPLPPPLADECAQAGQSQRRARLQMRRLPLGELPCYLGGGCHQICSPTCCKVLGSCWPLAAGQPAVCFAFAGPSETSETAPAVPPTNPQRYTTSPPRANVSGPDLATAGLATAVIFSPNR